jgi:7-keto-8-aminopelargonate synthetase-like enzyme
VLIDERSHASLLDAAQLFGCPIIPFRHLSAEACAAAVQRCGPAARPILLTDGLFSHDGEVAPLDRYLEVLPSAGSVLVDDAHGAGVLGRSGRGTAEYLGVPGERLIQTITLSKAFGVFGGAILGTRALRARMIARSRSFSGSTPMPLPLVCAALAAVKLLQTDRGLRRRLADKIHYVRSALREAGFPGAPAPGPIIPFVPRHAGQAALLKGRLLAAGIHPPFIHYPGGPESGFFRFALSSEHTQPQLDGLIRVFGPIAQAGLAGGAGAARSRRRQK